MDSTTSTKLPQDIQGINSLKLLEETRLGDLVLRNRMAMAPMTRSRATMDGVVGELTERYYTQRSTAGLIVSEGINISAEAQGSPMTPGLFTPAQTEAWASVTAAVHQAGGVIFAQLWHTGRVGHSADKGGKLPVAPSAIAIQGQQHFTSQGKMDYETPHALTTDEVKRVVQDYRKAAENAKAAGFDGVELHGAFGYLPNQFLVDSANQRTDEYGGSIENRSRFVLEVMQAIVDVWGPGRVGIKLSPSTYYNNMFDSDPVSLFSHLIGELDKLPLAYLHLMRATMPLDKFPHYPQDVLATFGGLTTKTIIANGGYQRDTAEADLAQGRAQMISFGVGFLANPDLPQRFAADAPLNAPDFATFYGGGEKGYIDYPLLPQS
jgi:N-ethylmaleimide reductase